MKFLRSIRSEDLSRAFRLAFLITLGLMAAEDHGLSRSLLLKDFFIRRTARIFPMYYAMLAAIALLFVALSLAPASMALTVGLARAGTQRADLIVPPMINPHIITPETETSSHYFYDHEDNAEAAAMARRVFVEEDEPMIEAAQRALGDQDFWDARPAILKTDAGAIRARRAISTNASARRCAGLAALGASGQALLCIRVRDDGVGFDTGLDGAVLVCRPGVRGLPEPLFQPRQP